MSKPKFGVVHGRFQVVHNDHLTYILEGSKRCENLIVGITSPDPFLAPAEETDPNRGEPCANPLTFFERLLMIENVLLDEGLPRDRFRIIPFPIGYPERLRYYAPEDARYYLTIYDAWGHAKRSRLEKLGLTVEVLWRRRLKGLTGTEVRKTIAAGGPWAEMVPRATARLVTEFNAVTRICDAHRAAIDFPV